MQYDCIEYRIQSKDYTSLAVTAMKWIDIQEVRAANLQSWLSSMKMKGYCLAGLEQTTNSISIEKVLYLFQPNY